ncbi:Mini-ribonuclease 3 [Caminicella sporogenes]|uniref:Mini-ribonuclease 3 n=1 Tax=Caminicella sporogenes TaxID=166485 RepID=UPI00253FB225|nr:Mini-ribonuclease 3 [Caminicella sporogenes]WIF95614.1 Mini-ribonuclease 3 [Caminicella sporogenes]
MKNFLSIMNLKEKSEMDIKNTHPLILAYIGDALYEVYIRTYIVYKYEGKVHEFHKLAIKFVKASGQAQIVHALQNQLTEEEWSIVKKGRNQKSATIPKNANISDYRYATGFESLLGYLYLKGDKERINEIISEAIKIIEKDIVNKI